MEDPYIIKIDEQWDAIMMVYSNFKDKKPIIEYDITNEKIFSYPAKEYIQTLSNRTRNQTEKQYKEATIKNQFLLFIKDFEKRKLKSYIFDLST
ncbi:MAG: hypothetical protein K8S18_08600 [Desulfobacula sp.]|nr:hypothetical protein [Desulfobacula sp.]